MDKPRNNKLAAMDKIWNNEFDLPTELKALPTTYKVVDSSASDALETATRTFATGIPRPTFQPLGPHPENKNTANVIERGLMWEFWNADKRSETRITPDVMRSSLRYDMVCIQVIHLPHHYDSIKASYKDLEEGELKDKKLSTLKKRRAAALRKGDFVLAVRNPQNVHAHFSELGIEFVVLCQEMKARDIMARWEKMASFLDDGTDDWEDKVWIYYDYEDIDERMVWAVEGAGGAVASEDHIVFHEQKEIPFISWAIRVGGTSLDTDPALRAKPYLNNVYTSGSYELICNLKTLYVSEAIKYAAGPSQVTETPTGEGVDVEYGTGQASIDLRPGENVSPWMPHAIDQGLMEVFDRTRADIDAQTNIRVLQNPDFPSGTAFATINALLKTTLNGLNRWRELAEFTFADMYELMLLWVSHTKRPIRAYGKNGKDTGLNYTIKPKDFSPDHIYLSVRMEADIATNKIEELNAAVMMHSRLQWPLGDLYEKLGEQDPPQLMKDRAFEDMYQNELGNRIEARTQQAQMEFQQKQMQMQAMAQAAQMGQTGQPQGPPQGPPPGMGGGTEAAFAELGGQGFNPNAAGTPPAVGMPEGTREELTGMDMSGQPQAV